MTATTATPSSAGTRTRSRTATRLMAVAGSVLAALAVWGVATSIGVDLSAGSGDRAQVIGAVPVLAASLTASLAGWLALSVLERITGKARTAWTAIAVAVLLLSLGGPVSGAATTGGVVALSAMHLAVGAVLIPMLRSSSSAR